MSARQLQRLERLKKPSEVEEEKVQAKDEEEEVTQWARGAFSSKAALAAFMDDDDSEDDDDDGKNKDEDAQAIATTVASSSTSTKSKKKKSKKKKPSNVKEKDDDDKFLESIVATTKSSVAADLQTNGTKDEDQSYRFSFSPETLDADKEVRRKLGKALNSGGGTQAKAAAATKQRRRLPPGMSVTTTAQPTSLPRHFVTSDKDWFPPPTFASGEGARMNKIGGDFFTFEASSSYAAAQRHYRQLVMTYDPNNLIELIQQHPFHVDSLLQLHDVFLSSGQNESALVMLRRALFTLESWCSPAFRQSLGHHPCRLALQGDMEEDELLQFDKGPDCGLNGALIRALALSMRVAGRRDCNETAFTIAKFLLSLAPDVDPAFALLSIDYYAIKNRVYEWVINTHTDEERRTLPCVAYGRAIAMNLIAKMPNATLPRAAADEALQKAIARFPKYAELVLVQSNRTAPSALEKLLTAPEELVDRLCNLSQTRQATLWTDDLTSWLFEISKGLGPIRTSDFSPPERAFMTRYARCRLSDLSDKVNLIPREELLADEMQRQQHINPMNREHEVGYEEYEEDVEAAPRPNVNLNLNNLMLFFQTMGPWARLPGGGVGGGESAAGGNEDDDNIDEWGEDID